MSGPGITKSSLLEHWIYFFSIFESWYKSEILSCNSCKEFDYLYMNILTKACKTKYDINISVVEGL